MSELTFKVEQFEGPLDLLEHLIKRNKLDICNISLIAITDQYLEYISSCKEEDLELSGEFLLVATDLLYIKSKALLPRQVDEPDPDEIANNLTEALKQRERMKIISEKFRAMQYDGSYFFFKEEEKLPKDAKNEQKRIEFANIDKLYDAFMFILEKQERRLPPSKDSFTGIVARQIVSVKSRATTLVDKLKGKKNITFYEAFGDCKYRGEVVATFLAMLELVKLNHINIYDDTDGNILVSLGETTYDITNFNFE